MFRMAAASPRLTARIAGAFYLVTFVAGVIALVSLTGRVAANGIATAAYIIVTLLFYVLFRPVSKSLSLVAALISLAGLGVGVLNMLHLAPFNISPLVFFGFYCLLVGYLILKSSFLPCALGALMVLGGLGWLTFAWPPLSRSLAPYNLAPGMIAEGVLTIWLLVAGVNAQKWQEQAAAGAASPSRMRT